MTEHRRRIDRILEPEYIARVDTRSEEELRAMHDECTELETEVSYVRRLAQARIDILQAEIERRAAGGSLGDLIAALPQILAGDDGRPAPASTHLPQHFAPRGDIEWNRGLERLVNDSTLVNLPSLSDEELNHTLEQLRQFENETSTARKALHGVLDVVDHELAARAAVEQR